MNKSRVDPHKTLKNRPLPRIGTVSPIEFADKVGKSGTRGINSSDNKRFGQHNTQARDSMQTRVKSFGEYPNHTEK